MNKFYVISNRKKEESMETAKRVRAYLTGRGKQCVIAEQERDKTQGFLYTNPGHIEPDTDCIISAGGDGTLIQAAADLVNLGIPFLGINCGTLGFLTEVDSTRVEEALDRLLSGDFQTEERMMLKGTVLRDGKKVNETTAINDISINRSGTLRIIDIHVSVNGRFLTDYAADGIILSTPTGSTAYNLSAGGPIVSPQAKVMLMTPICAHTINNRTIVFSPEDTLEIEIGKGRYEENEPRMVSFDGVRSCPVYDGDRIIIQESEKTTKLIKLSSMSFLEVLRRKMGGT